jgi:hypothetical protein
VEAAIFVLILDFLLLLVYAFSDCFCMWCFTWNSFLKVASAEKTAVLFTKDGDQHNNLHDMQCMWSVCLIIVTKSCFK